MKKLVLRPEYLGELAYHDLRQVRGAAPLNTVSDNSCGCVGGGTIAWPNTVLAGACEVSDGSCACVCNGGGTG